MNMIVALSGTPGTGKTAVAKELKHIHGVKIISLNELLKKGEIKSGFDRDRKTRSVSEKELKKAVSKNVAGGVNLVEGHLSHLVKFDLCIILRCRPDVLEKRMRKKAWSKKKIDENLKAEILDSCTIEALRRSKNVVEIDTTRLSIKKTAETVKKLLNNFNLRKRYAAGSIDWSERFFAYLAR